MKTFIVHFCLGFGILLKPPAVRVTCTNDENSITMKNYEYNDTAFVGINVYGEPKSPPVGGLYLGKDFWIPPYSRSYRWYKLHNFTGVIQTKKEYIKGLLVIAFSDEYARDYPATCKDALEYMVSKTLLGKEEQRCISELFVSDGVDLGLTLPTKNSKFDNFLEERKALQIQLDLIKTFKALADKLEESFDSKLLLPFKFLVTPTLFDIPFNNADLDRFAKDLQKVVAFLFEKHLLSAGDKLKRTLERLSVRRSPEPVTWDFKLLVQRLAELNNACSLAGAPCLQFHNAP